MALIQKRKHVTQLDPLRGCRIGSVGPLNWSGLKYPQQPPDEHVIFLLHNVNQHNIHVVSNQKIETML